MRPTATLLLTASVIASTGCSKEPPPAAIPLPSDPSERPLSSAKQSPSNDLEPMLQGLRRATGTFQTPSEQQQSEWKDWMAHLISSLDGGNLPTRAAPNGFAGRFVDAGRLWVIGEQGPNKIGAGAYVLRPGAKNALVIQAPHTFFDQGTLPLALTLFEQLDAKALMINTMHRAAAGGGAQGSDEADEDRQERARSGQEASDLAHSSNSYFQVTHSLFGAEWPGTRFIQLHGFRDEKAPGASVIVSAAGTNLDPLPVARSLNAVLGAGTALVYPEEINKLGGTTNIQARACKEAGWPFLHLEISATLRQRMERQASLREQFAEALSRALLLKH